MPPLIRADLDAARRFLNRFDAAATSWTFQTFDDNAARKDRTLAVILHGSIDEHFERLCGLSDRGAGVFFMPNRGDGSGREAKNVLSVRAVYVDLDGAPLEPLLKSEARPQLIVSTSPGKWHAYWPVIDCAIDRFRSVQKALIRRFGSDAAVHDLPRVMRLPGFLHRKDPNNPYLADLVHDFGGGAYRIAELETLLQFEAEPPVEERRLETKVDSGSTLTAGARHGALLAYAGRLRQLGTSDDEIYDALVAVNTRRCDPPKSAPELREIAAYVAKKPAGDDQFADTRMAPAPVIECASVVSLEPPEPIEFDIDTILPSPDAPALMFGPPGSLKSWIALAMCDAVVRGAPFAALAVRQRPRALYINIDAGGKTFRNRVRAASSAAGFDFVSLTAAQFSGEWLRSALPEYRGGFLVIDCLSSVYAPDMRKDPAHAMRTFVDDLRSLYAEFDLGGVIVDHPHRPKETGGVGDYHGSIQKEAAFRTMWSVVAEKPDEANAPHRVKIMHRKLSEGPEFSPILLDVTFGSLVSICRADVADPVSRSSAIEAKIVEWAARQIEAFSKRAVETKIKGFRATEVRRALDTLIDAERIVPTGAKRGPGHLFRLRPDSGRNPDALDASGIAVPGDVNASPISLIGDALTGTHSPDPILAAPIASGLGTQSRDENTSSAA